MEDCAQVMCKNYAILYKGLEHLSIGYPWEVLEPIPCGYQEMAVCHSLFIHAYVDAHLGHIHPLAIVDNAAINTGVQTFSESLLSILCHMINSMFNFLRNHQTFP